MVHCLSLTVANAKLKNQTQKFILHLRGKGKKTI